MIDIKAISIPKIPFNIKRVGTLFYHEFPVTAVYSDDQKTPFMLEWVDCDENNVDRFFLYQTTKENLFQFIFTKYTHFNLITECVNGTVILFDGDLNNPKNIKVVAPLSLPLDYLPDSNVLFAHSESVDENKIIGFFELEDVRIAETITLEIPKIAQNNKSEIINLYLKEGKGIGYGKIETSILANTLNSFEHLYRQVALDFIRGKDRDEKALPRDTKEQREYKEMVDLLSSTEVLPYVKAASFGIFIKPITQQQNLLEGTTSSEATINKVFELFTNSESPERLKESTNDLSPYSLAGYKAFLTTIKNHDIKVDVNWYSPFNNHSNKKEFTSGKADSILNNFKVLEKKEPDFFNLIGKFREVDTGTRHYVFVANDGYTYTGYFDKKLMEGLPLILFPILYEVVVNREIKFEPDKSIPTITDQIVAYFKKD